MDTKKLILKLSYLLFDKKVNCRAVKLVKSFNNDDRIIMVYLKFPIATTLIPFTYKFRCPLLCDHDVLKNYIMPQLHYAGFSIDETNTVVIYNFGVFIIPFLLNKAIDMCNSDNTYIQIYTCQEAFHRKIKNDIVQFSIFRQYNMYFSLINNVAHIACDLPITNYDAMIASTNVFINLGICINVFNQDDCLAFSAYKSQPSSLFIETDLLKELVVSIKYMQQNIQNIKTIIISKEKPIKYSWDYCKNYNTVYAKSSKQGEYMLCYYKIDENHSSVLDHLKTNIDNTNIYSKDGNIVIECCSY